MKKEKGILFDLDGTLWDVCEPVTRCWNLVLTGKYARYGKSVTQEEIRSYMGRTLEDIAAAVFPDTPESERVAILRDCCAQECGHLRQTGGVLYPQLRETLICLRQAYGLAVVSNCQNGYIEAFLHAHDMGGLFDEYECSGRTGLTKGENIRLVMERAGWKEGVYVGDTRWDEEAAAQAEIPFIHAAYGFGGAQAPQGVIHRPQDLPAVLQDLWTKPE